MVLFKLSKSALVSFLHASHWAKLLQSNSFSSLLSFRYSWGIRKYYVCSAFIIFEFEYGQETYHWLNGSEWMLPVFSRQSLLTEPHCTSSIQRNPRLALINYGTKSISRANKRPKKEKGCLPAPGNNKKRNTNCPPGWFWRLMGRSVLVVMNQHSFSRNSL